MCDCIAVTLLHLGNFMGYPSRCKFAVNQNIVQNVEHNCWHSPTSAANSRAIYRRSAYNREARSWTLLFSTWGRPLRKLSWAASLPSRNALTHRATVWYGNVAPPHSTRGPWKLSCVLRHRANLILIQESCSSFLNMVLGHSHYPYKSQRSTEYCRRWLR